MTPTLMLVGAGVGALIAAQSSMSQPGQMIVVGAACAVGFSLSTYLRRWIEKRGTR